MPGNLKHNYILKLKLTKVAKTHSKTNKIFEENLFLAL